MRRLIIGFSLAVAGWVCAGIYLILTAQSIGHAVSHGDPSSVANAAAMFGLGAVSWLVLILLGSFFGIPSPRFLRRKQR